MVFRYSAIQTAYSCLYRYKLEYIDGIKPAIQSADMEFGKALHLALKAYFDKEDPVAVFNLFWNTIKEQDLKYTRFNWQELKEQGTKLVERWVKLHAKKFTPYKTEERVKYSVGEHQFEGTPDYIGEYEGVPSIVDWKTSAVAYTPSRIITDEQMYLYAKAVEQNYDYPIKQLAYMTFVKGNDLRIQSNIKLELTKAKLKSMLDNVKLMCDDLSTRKQFPKNRKSCGGCPHFQHCYQEK